LVGVDIQPANDYPGTFVLRSIHEIPSEELISLLGGEADLVISDMAPAASGHRSLDHVRQIELASAALECAITVLKKGGSMVVKVFEGSEATAFQQTVKQHFAKVKRVRPEATRKNSVEFFLVAQNRR